MTLIAYYTGEQKIEKLHEYLREFLPLFMIPSIIIWLPRFPETLNGKRDTNELPDPHKNESIRYVKTNNYISPRNNLEKELKEIFIGIIGCEDISVTESILNVGATSIMFSIFIKKIKDTYNKELSMVQFIKNSTIELCAKLLESL